MSFSISCDKCGAVAKNIKELEEYFPQEFYRDNQEFTDQFKSIIIRSQASYNFTSELYIECKCGNEM